MQIWMKKYVHAHAHAVTHMPLITKWPCRCLFCGCVAFLKWIIHPNTLHDSDQSRWLSATDWSSLFWKWHLTLSPDRSGIHWMSCKARWAYGNTQMKVLWAQCQRQLTDQRACTRVHLRPSMSVSDPVTNTHTHTHKDRLLSTVGLGTGVEGVCVHTDVHEGRLQYVEDNVTGIEVWSFITLRGFISG